MNGIEFENKIDEIVDKYDVEIDDELSYNYELNECLFYISSLLKNTLINDDDVVENNKKIDEIVENIVDDIENEFDNVDVEINDDEFIIKLNNDEFEFDDVDELYDDMKIYF